MYVLPSSVVMVTVLSVYDALVGTIGTSTTLSTVSPASVFLARSVTVPGASGP